MTLPGYSAIRTPRLIAQGLCTKCGKVLARPTHRRCASCSEHRRKQWATLSPQQKQAKIDYNRNRRQLTHSGLEGCKTWRRRLKEEVITAYGHHCKCCGETRFEFLTLDHVNNDGARHRREISNKVGRVASGHRLYFWAKSNKYPSLLQVLCWNCNCAKYYFKKCPHST